MRNFCIVLYTLTMELTYEKFLCDVLYTLIIELTCEKFL